MIDEGARNKIVSIDADNQRVSGEEEVIEHTEELTSVAEDVDRIQNGTYVERVDRRPIKQLESPHVFWERFLSLGSLKVLLVENKDSTRHLVSAILHNCGYEENGVQAWTILEELTSQINIVLTEVTMPCLSGIQLLSRIMSHKTCKSIPVIMMSSNDSMNIVFKCLSKGAVDYLVKPLRKNELKNLWLHVWRRFHSPSDSGSICGVQTQKATKSRSHEDLGNETAGKSEGYSGSIDLDRDGSDNGSGTQSSWTKRAAEYDSPQPMSHQDQPAYRIGSTFAQFINPREMQGGSWVPLPAAGESVGQDNTLAATAVTQVSDVKLAKTPYLPCGERNRKLETHSVVIYSNKPFGKNCTNEDAWKEIKHLGNKKEKLHHDPEKVLPIEFTTKRAAPQMISETDDLPIGHSNVSSMNNTTIIDGLYMPSVELTLRAPQEFKDSIESSHDRSIFQHSDFSAFLRYNSVSTANQRRTRNVRSSPGENSSDATKTTSEQNHQSESNNTQTNQGLYGSSSNDNTCSTANIAPKVPADFNEKGNSEFMSIQPSSAPQPMQNSHLSCPQPIRFNDNTFVAAEKSFYQQIGIHQETNKLCNHHFHSHYPYIYCMPQMEQLANHDNTSLQCGFSDIPGGSQIQGNAGDYTLDKSVSGSNHRSNRQTGYSIGVNPNGRNMETENVRGERSGANGGTGEGVGQNHFSNRETALNRFRQKKKGRCFEKKIRYQNRKKLAEQRPRIRGQFVRKGGETSKENDSQS